ncbi:MAG TPA: isopentenyl-diphosphate Delta-isomerase [Gemmatimonadaceae bacterium]
MANDEEEHVVLVDVEDMELGSAPKLDAHRKGLLHRAFSVFLLDRDGRILLQQRAASKYHSPGRWSNTCCGHPRRGEATVVAARRRLGEEMGILCEIERAGSFLYRAAVAPDLIEHEFDHVLIGHFDGEPTPNQEEVSAWRWEFPHLIAEDLAVHQDAYSVWLSPALRVLSQCLPWVSSPPEEASVRACESDATREALAELRYFRGGMTPSSAVPDR